MLQTQGFADDDLLVVPDDVVEAPQYCDGRLVLGNARTDRFFLLSAAQETTWRLLAGGLPAGSVAARVAEEHGTDLSRTQRGIDQFLAQLFSQGILSSHRRAELPVRERSVRISWQPATLGASISFALSDRLRNLLQRVARTRWCSSWAVLGVTLLAAPYGTREVLRGLVSPLSIASLTWPYIVALWTLIFMSILAHEAAHAVAAARLGSPPARAGVMARYILMPGAFVDTTGVWKARTWEKVWVGAAGPWMSAVLGAAALWTANWTSGRFAIVLALFGEIQLYVALYNVIPFYRGSDGFGMANDLLRTRDWRVLLRALVPRRRTDVRTTMTRVFSRTDRSPHYAAAVLLGCAQLVFLWWLYPRVISGVAVLTTGPPIVLVVALAGYQLYRGHRPPRDGELRTLRWRVPSIPVLIVVASLAALIAQGAVFHLIAPRVPVVIAAESLLGVVVGARVLWPALASTSPLGRVWSGGAAILAAGVIALYSRGDPGMYRLGFALACLASALAIALFKVTRSRSRADVMGTALVSGAP
jgi:hypothetical protein